MGIRPNISLLVLCLVALLAGERAFAAQPEIKAPFDHGCKLDYSNLGKLQLAVDNSRPQIHAMNMRETMAEFRLETSSTLKITKINEKLHFACVTDGFCFSVREIVDASDGMKMLRFKDVDGISYEVIARPFGAYFKIDPRKIKNLATAQLEYSPEEVKMIRRDFLSSPVANLDAEGLGRYLTGVQLRNSGNVARNPDNLEFRKGISEINSLLASRLKNKQVLTTDDLDRMNWLANQGLVPLADQESIPFAGVMRGTSDRGVVVKGKSYVADATRIQSGQGGGGVHVNNFLPAHQVPPALTKLVEKINQLSPASDPVAVFALYKEFIHIHGYLDANGREGRSLLNFMLLKAQLPIIDRASESLFFTPEELANHYLDELVRRRY
ncbi:MAG: Fic family protein [Bdellovibrionota bacterium]